jgi:hypothetical protein
VPYPEQIVGTAAMHTSLAALRPTLGAGNSSIGGIDFYPVARANGDFNSTAVVTSQTLVITLKSDRCVGQGGSSPAQGSA